MKHINLTLKNKHDFSLRFNFSIKKCSAYAHISHQTLIHNTTVTLKSPLLSYSWRTNHLEKIVTSIRTSRSDQPLLRDLTKPVRSNRLNYSLNQKSIEKQNIIFYSVSFSKKLETAIYRAKVWRAYWNIRHSQCSPIPASSDEKKKKCNDATYYSACVQLFDAQCDTQKKHSDLAVYFW